MPRALTTWFSAWLLLLLLPLTQPSHMLKDDGLEGGSWTQLARGQSHSTLLVQLTKGFFQRHV